MTTFLERDNVAKKHQSLEAQWRRHIETGVWEPGDRLPTFTELCRTHKVSRTTIERVCRALEQEGLIVRRHGSGTYVQPKPPRVQHGFIGFTGYGFHRQPRPRYWTYLQDGVQEVAMQQEQSLVLLDMNSPKGWDRLDGVLFSDVSEKDLPERLRHAPLDLPRVSLLFNLKNESCVVADDYEGGKIATEHLLELGHRRIAFLTESTNVLAQRRVAGYLDALLQAGIAPNARWMRNYGEPGRLFPHFAERGKEVMRQWLRESWHKLGCTALLVVNDQIASGVLSALQEAGIEVPREVSIVGFDNSEICDYLTPRLTSVNVPLHEIGTAGMELLLHQIDRGKSTPSTTVLPMELQVRNSTAKAIV